MKPLPAIVGALLTVHPLSRLQHFPGLPYPPCGRFRGKKRPVIGSPQLLHPAPHAAGKGQIGRLIDHIRVHQRNEIRVHVQNRGQKALLTGQTGSRFPQAVHICAQTALHKIKSFGKLLNFIARTGKHRPAPDARIGGCFRFHSIRIIFRERRFSACQFLGAFAEPGQPAGHGAGEEAAQAHGRKKSASEQNGNGRNKLAGGRGNARPGKSGPHCADTLPGHDHRCGEIVDIDCPRVEQLDVHPLVVGHGIGPDQIHRKSSGEGMSGHAAVGIQHEEVHHVSRFAEHGAQPQMIPGQQRLHHPRGKTFGQGRAAHLALVQQSGGGHAGHHGQKHQRHAAHNGDDAEVEFGFKLQTV